MRGIPEGVPFLWAAVSVCSKNMDRMFRIKVLRQFRMCLPLQYSLYKSLVGFAAIAIAE